ncbi:MAG TPA: NAD(P)/FAD-dependent oxidoreductase [Pseudonocardiaceae bacterium]
MSDRIVIVGGGFAGYHCARRLSRLGTGEIEIVLINPTDYFLYLPLLPRVTGGLLDPRRVAVSLTATLPGVRLVLAQVTGVDINGRRVRYVDAGGRSGELGYERLVLSVGSVNKLLPIPGVADHAHGYRGLPEALYLRDHLIQQIELADTAEDRLEREARLTFVVVGAGYTGTEVTAHGQLLTQGALERHPRLDGYRCRWILLDTAPRILPELHPHLSRTARHVLRDRGVDVRTGTSVTEATGEGVHLSDGTFVPSLSLIWCVGVRPDPLVDTLGLPTQRGRLVVDEYLTVPGHPEVYACGDAAAVPDLTRPGQLTGMTAQHAERQGRLAATNVVATFGHGRRRPYRHRDLGFLVDLGDGKAAANPLHVPLSGPVASAVTSTYHLLALPANRVRVAVDTVLNTITSLQVVQLGLISPQAVPLESDSPETPRQAR